MGKTEIVHFAQNVLGCGCDNSVFDSIDTEENVELDCGVSLKRRIVIGNRLLIYIGEENLIKPADLGKVFKDGVTERNGRGYNRLRVVILTPDAGKLFAAYNDVFINLTERDEKTHLHIISEKDANI